MDRDPPLVHPANPPRPVFSHILIPLGLIAQLLLGAGPAVAQAQGPAAAVSAATDRAAGDAFRLQRQRGQKLAEKRSLERTYEAQLRELDRLKRSRATWRRDREIRSNKAESQATAERLSRVDGELRAIETQLRRQRQALLAALDREVGLGPSPPRRAFLVRLRAQVSAALQPRVRKILVPDDTLDELADPDDLAEQIALIAQAEAELRGEREALRQREDRYARMIRLRDQRERASQMNELEEDVVRRTGGRADRNFDSEGDSAGGGQEEPPPEPPSGPPNEDVGVDDGPVGPSTGGTTGGGPVSEDSGFEQSSILLTDVVDSSTIDALRRASRSSSARARADAAARARKQVESRLQRLERNRTLIQRHLDRLRRGR
jgi:hypothetical protein